MKDGMDIPIIGRVLAKEMAGDGKRKNPTLCVSYVSPSIPVYLSRREPPRLERVGEVLRVSA